MTIDPAVVNQYRVANDVLTELEKQYQNVALTGREPDRTKKLEALESAIALYARTTHDLAIQLADDLVAIHLPDAPLPYALTAAGAAAAGDPDYITADRQAPL
jgi:hypothetical protein